MKKIVTTLLVTSLALGGFAVAHAHSDRYDYFGKSGKFCNQKGMKHGLRSDRMFEHRSDYMYERLDLSKEQIKKVRSIRNDYRPKLEDLSDKVSDNRKKLRDAMHSGTINQAQVKKLAKKMGELKEDKINLHAEMRTKIHKVLTKEQREEINDMKDHRGYGPRFGHHG